MKTPVLIAALIIGLAAAFPPEFGIRSHPGFDLADATAAATVLVGQLGRERMDSVVGNWDSTLALRLPADSLAAVWRQIRTTAGPIETIGKPTAGSVASFTNVEVPVALTRAKVVIRVSFDVEGRVAGLYFLPRP